MASYPWRLLVAAALVWMTPQFIGTAAAHPLAPALLEIVEQAPGRADVRWKTPLTAVPGAALRPRLPPQCSTVGRPGEQTVDVARIQRWEIRCSEPLAGSRIEVEDIGASKADVVLRVALADGRTFNTVLSAGQPWFVVPPRDSPLAISWSYMALGFEHILTGFDHMLFVFALMLLVPGWALLVGTITAFSVGHSVTLSLAVLGFVRVPQGPVEALIALSVFIMAVELSRDRSTATPIRRFPWAVAFSFGLLHGLGFAGALAEAGLPVGEIPLALLSFNLGIELGQLALCAGILGLYMAVRDLRLPRLAREPRMAAYPIGSLAALWLFERSATMMW